MNKYITSNGMEVKQANTGVLYSDPYYSEDYIVKGNEFYIIRESGKHGIVYRDRKNVVVEIEYDDISCLWVFNGCDESGYECEYPYPSEKFLTMNFKLCLNGKIGLHKITINRFTEIITQERIFEIDCDEISNLSDWSWAFKNKKGWRYTCFLTGVVSGYYKYITIANELCKLFHAYDGEKHFLITERTGKIVYEKSDKYHGLIYIGSNNFYYLNNQQVLFEKDDKWKMQTDYNVIAPITIFPFPTMVLSNVANIIKKDNMLGLVDGEGNEILKPDYNEIICELKITAIKDYDDKMIEKYRVLCKRNSLDDLYGENGGDKYSLKK